MLAAPFPRRIPAYEVNVMNDVSQLFSGSFDHSAFSGPARLAELPRDPAAIVRGSALIERSCATIAAAAASIRDEALQKACLDLLKSPELRFLDRWHDHEKVRALHAELTGRGLLDPAKTSADDLFPPHNVPVQPFEAAPGSGWNSHHAYPGGLAVHVALNIETSLACCGMYEKYYGYQLDRDTVLAAQIAHDIAKVRIHQWQPDGSFRADYPVAGKGGHLVMSLAEAIVRGLPAKVILAQACAHTAPNTAENEAAVVRWLTAACLMAESDPVELGLLDETRLALSRPHRQEWFAVHYGDGDYVLSMPAAKRAVALLRRLAAEEYSMNENDLGGARFNAFRNFAGAHLSFMKIDELAASRGFTAVREAVATIVQL